MDRKTNGCNLKKVVVIGGGTGTSVVLSGLKETGLCDLSAIVVVSDSGGSTGRLRDEFGFLPVGDLRQCLAALADGKYQQEVRDMLLYRFSKGNGLTGHNLGNLILTALEDIKLSPGKAIETASHIFRIKGSVYPITENDVNLVIEYEDGTVKIGESHLDDSKLGGKRIKHIKLTPNATIYPKAALALEQADLVILGPGDLYGSILPNTLVRGFKPALQKTKAKLVYIVNLMTHFSQTHNMTARDHVATVAKYCGRMPDVVIMNQNHISAKLIEQYERNQEYPVADDLNGSGTYTIIRDHFISQVTTKQHANDTVQRSLLRHDSKQLAKTLISLLD